MTFRDSRGKLHEGKTILDTVREMAEESDCPPELDKIDVVWLDEGTHQVRGGVQIMASGNR